MKSAGQVPSLLVRTVAARRGGGRFTLDGGVAGGFTPPQVLHDCARAVVGLALPLRNQAVETTEHDGEVVVVKQRTALGGLPSRR